MPSHEYRLTHGEQALRPLMIIPTLEKAVLENPYSSLLTTFSDSLKTIEVLFIIGNSMRDAHITNTIGVRRSGLEIVSVNPNAGSQSVALGAEGEVHGVPIGTKEFMTLGLPMLDRWVSEGGHDTPVDQLEVPLAQFVGGLCSKVQVQVGMDEDERMLVGRMRNASWEERVDLIRNVQRGAHQEVVAVIRAFAQSGENDAEQVAAIDALSDLVDTGAIDILCEVATGGSSLPVRAEATLALKHIVEAGGIDISEELERMRSGDRMVQSLMRHRIGTT